MAVGADITRSLKVGHVSRFLMRSSVISSALPPPFTLFSLSYTSILHFFSSSHPHTRSINMESKIDKELHFSDLTVLDSEKVQQLDDVLKSILNSSIAEDTFAQIIDGRPTWQSQPSQEARDKYNECRASFSAQVLKLDTQVR